MVFGSDGAQNDLVLTILKTTDEVNQLKDVDSILDKILEESRRLAGADAGSIFLVEGESLTFRYVQNETLFRSEGGNAALYQNFTLPISEDSIVGYVAKHKKSLAIDDAYTLASDSPFSFNNGFDVKSGYKTVSMLTIPLVAQESRLVGVMQLINALDEQGNTVPFGADAQTYVPLFCNNAAVAIERGIMNRELILRMMQMAELRDPTETGTHVQRVGAISAELYGTWAVRRGKTPKEVKHMRDNMRLAAMLHDVGKVGISDLILKKPGKLTGEEFEMIKMHTVYGGRLFRNQTSELDHMSMEIALHHHERWDGKGYPGKATPDLRIEGMNPGSPLAGEDIPIGARICAVADVYDALSSARSYKKSFPEERCLGILKQDAGTHFDPEIVEIFMEIYDVIKAIKNKYRERGAYEEGPFA